MKKIFLILVICATGCSSSKRHTLNLTNSCFICNMGGDVGGGFKSKISLNGDSTFVCTEYGRIGRGKWKLSSNKKFVLIRCALFSENKVYNEFFKVFEIKRYWWKDIDMKLKIKNNDLLFVKKRGFYRRIDGCENIDTENIFNAFSTIKSESNYIQEIEVLKPHSYEVLE